MFLLFFVALGTVIWALASSGFFTWIGIIASRHRRVLMLGAFVVAFLFPFTQGGSDANMSIATQVIIFAATALGLNIVVGLAGLLDLGYIAFLGAGRLHGGSALRLGVRDPPLEAAVPPRRAPRRLRVGHASA